VELCATPLAAFMEFAAKHGVPPLNYGIEELEEDRRTWSSLRRSREIYHPCYPRMTQAA
jgi:hypothetical protein